MVPPYSGWDKERIYVKELAQFLHHRTGLIKRFAKEEGLLRKVSCGHGRPAAYYVSPYGAMRIIAWVRAMQGQVYLEGKDYHGLRAKQREWNRRSAERVKNR